jgi:hypothetical protein
LRYPDLMWVWLLALFLSASGCTNGDWSDDDSGDDDSGDDDSGDDDSGDDDSGDDDTGDEEDLDAATIPDFPDCTGNQVKLRLGDGTEIGPVNGLDSAASFANHTGAFKIQVGGAMLWTAISGNGGGMQAGSPITFQPPHETPGNAVLQGYIGASEIGTSDPAMAVGYGMVAAGLDERVGGVVTFDAVPDAGQQSSGTFSGILQGYIGQFTPRVILLGVSGCFSGVLEATDAGR